MTQTDALNMLKLGENVFLTGAPGAGKTYLLNQYIQFLENHQVEVAVTAYTGIAASHINGRTLHSWAGLTRGPAMSEEQEIDRVRRSDYLTDRIKTACVLIIDEISMLHPAEFDRVDLICRTARRSPEPFGGLQLICCGDFFQIPPVNGENEKFVIDSVAWKNANMRVCYLHEQHRQGDVELLGILAAIRSGQVTPEVVKLLEGRINAGVAAPIGIARLYTHRENVDEINKTQLQNLKEQEVVYEVREFGPAAMIEKLKRDNDVDTMSLKVGARVMFTKNNMGGGYVNGTLGEVVGFTNDGDASDDDDGASTISTEADPIIMTFDKKRITLGRHQWKVDENGKTRAFVSQLPLKLAWAITVHKSQGMTLDAAEIDLGRAFDRGMGYVALSRVRELKNITLVGFNTMALQVSPRVQLLDKGFLGASAGAEQYLHSLTTDEQKQLQSEFLGKEKGSESTGKQDVYIDYSGVDELPVLDF